MTKGELAQRILKLMGVNTRFSDASPEEIEDVLNYTEDWMLSENAIGRRLGWNQADGAPDPEDDSGLPDWAVLGVTGSVAAIVCSYFDKQVTQGIMLAKNSGMNTINARTIEVQEVQYPRNFPRGQGNTSPWGPKYWHYGDRIQTFNDFLTDEGDDPITAE